LRASGLIPAVCYGPYQAPVHLSLNPDALKKALATPKRYNTVLQLKITDSGQTSERLALLKDYETDPVEGDVLHADFLEVRLDKTVRVNVPLVLLGKPVGVTEGGILNQVRRAIELECLPRAIPEKLEISVEHLKIGHSVHVSELKAPEGTRIPYTHNFTIATVAVPAKEEVAVVAPTAALPGVEGAAAVPGAPGAPGAPGTPAVGAVPGAPGAAAGAAGAAPGAAGAPARGGKGEKK
jgi:large subunit ribosomal protein L25